MRLLWLITKTVRTKSLFRSLISDGSTPQVMSVLRVSMRPSHLSGLHRLKGERLKR
jgi:hypothetical protein